MSYLSSTCKINRIYQNFNVGPDFVKKHFNESKPHEHEIYFHVHVFTHLMSSCMLLFAEHSHNSIKPRETRAGSETTNFWGKKY